MKIYIVTHRDIIVKGKIFKNIPDRAFVNHDNAKHYTSNREDQQISEMFEMDLEW
jgi:hypothetical protein